MEHQLSLTLRLLRDASEELCFGLEILNRSPVSLLLPRPEIHGLRFADNVTAQESEWYTRLLVHSNWTGFALEPGHTKNMVYRVRPCAVAAPDHDDGSDYYRWCVALPAGEYSVFFRFRVGEDSFCPDSHARFEGLQCEAELQSAVVWTGEVMSNCITLVRA